MDWTILLLVSLHLQVAMVYLRVIRIHHHIKEHKND